MSERIFLKKNIIKKGGLYYPASLLKEKAYLSNEEIYKEAEVDPLSFWEKRAEGLFWRQRWNKVFEHNPPFFRWFVDGKLNITENIFERNPKGWENIQKKIAIIWQPEPLEESVRKITYKELFQKVNQAANVLKDLGVKKGDRVVIYLPMIPEVIVAMLACARIGAVHSVVFSAYSSAALKTRIEDCQGKVLITADGYYRRGKVINLKESADKGVEGTSIEKVLVVKRAGNEVNWKEGRDVWWEEALKEKSPECPAEAMDSEDLQFILYTSGCCHKDTLIQLDTGEIKKISDLVEKGGSTLVNVDLDKLQQDSDPITNRYRYKWPSKLWVIHTSLSKIKVTPNHPFFVLQDDGTFVEKKAQQLKEGEHILQMTKVEIEGHKQKLPPSNDISYDPQKCNQQAPNKPRIPGYLTAGFSQLLGYLLGDGGLEKVKVCATDKDKNNLLFYKSLVERELGLRCYIRKYDRQRLVINSAFLARYLQKAFPEIFANSYKRQIPKIVQRSDNKTLAAFIKGFFDAEGSVSRGRVGITSQSKELIQSLQMLFLRFGIVANYFEEERKTHIGGRDYKILVPGLKITDRQSLEIFQNKIGFSSKEKTKRLNSLVEGLKGKNIRSNLHQVPINGLLKLLRKTIMLPKKETQAIHLSSYLYSNRRIKKDRLSQIRAYVEQKIKFIEGLNLATREDIKTAIHLFKLGYKDLAKITNKSIHTVHQYHGSKNPRISERAKDDFYAPIRLYLMKLREKKIKVLYDILEKIKKLEELKSVGFFEIKKITKEENETNLVYDLTALRNHNYIANGFVVHNSTGRPKGTMQACGGYMVQSYWTGRWIFDWKDDDLFWSTADIGWITGHTYSCYSPLLNGITFLIFEGAPDWPEPNRWAKIIEEHKVSIFYTAPTAVRMFRKYGEDKLRGIDLSSLRILGSVGEPIDESAWLWYFKYVGNENCPILDTWWQTETGGILITSLPGIGPFRPCYAGRPLPGLRFEILDDRGQVVPPGKRGKLVLRKPFCPALLRGVYNNPEKYKKTYWSEFGEELYFTEDAALKDENNLIRIVGRTDDVLKVAGHRLTTGEMENVITTLEKVAECAVVGVPDEIKGQVPVVFAVIKGADIEKEEIKEKIVRKVREEIGPIAKPAEIYLVEDLPKTRSGKIMRRILRSLLTGGELGDVSTLANPECLERLKRALSS